MAALPRSTRSISGQFWNQEIQSTRSPEGIAHLLPCTLPPLGGQLPSGFIRSQQLLLLQQLGRFPFTPCFENQGEGGVVLDRVLYTNGGRNWWATVLCRARVQKALKLWADGGSHCAASRGGAWPRDIETGDAPVEGDALHLAPPTSFTSLVTRGSLYALCSRIRVGLGNLATLTGNIELDSLAGLGEQPGFLRNLSNRARRRAVLRKQLPQWEITAEAHWNGRFVDACGAYHDVPHVMAADLRSKRLPHGIRYRVGVHRMVAPHEAHGASGAYTQGEDAGVGRDSRRCRHAQAAAPATGVDAGAISPLCTGTHVQAALTMEREKMLWRKTGPSPHEQDENARVGRATRSAVSRVLPGAPPSVGSSPSPGASGPSASAGVGAAGPNATGAAGMATSSAAGASAGPGGGDALVTSGRPRGASHKKRRPRLLPYGSLCGWPRVTVGALLGVLARGPLPLPLRPLDALTHASALGAFSSVGVTARLGTMSKPWLDFSSLSVRLDASTGLAPTISKQAGSARGASWPMSSGLDAPLGNGEAGASSQPHRIAPTASTDPYAYIARPQEGADPLLAGNGAATCTLWGGAPPRRIMTASFTQQLVGPVRARVDARFDLDRGGDGGASGGSGAQGLMDLNYCLDCLLGPGGPARVCLWYSPIQKQAMAELRMLEL